MRRQRLYPRLLPLVAALWALAPLAQAQTAAPAAPSAPLSPKAQYAADSKQAKARYDNGVLTLTLPKKQGNKTQRLMID